MFIPTWIVVVVVVLVGSFFWRQIWDTIQGLAILAIVLALLASIPLVLYLAFVEKNKSAEFVFWVAFALIGLWHLFMEGRTPIHSSMRLHELRVKMVSASKPEKLINLRRKFAESLGLGRKLWQFYEDVHHFPSWYTCTLQDGTPWTSNVIKREEIQNIHGNAGRESAGLDPSILDDGSGEALVYSFESEGKPFAFCSRASSRTPDPDIDGEHRAERLAWVIEKPDRVVLKLGLVYYPTAHGETFMHAWVHAFKPGEWLPTLLTIVDNVHQDEREKHARWSKAWEKERAEKDFA